MSLTWAFCLILMASIDVKLHTINHLSCIATLFYATSVKNTEGGLTQQQYTYSFKKDKVNPPYDYQLRTVEQ